MNAEGNADAFETSPRSPWFFAQVVLGFGLFAALGLIAFVALQSDGQTDAPAPAETAIGVVLASGGLYHAHAELLDHRALVSARIANLRTPPDVLIIADRKWQLVQQDLRWEKQVFGAYINSLSPDDIHAILRQLETQQILPKKIVLGISPQFLMHVPSVKRESKLEPITSYLSPPGSGFLDVLPNFDRQAEPRPGVSPLDARLDTMFPDGSNIWSTQRSKAIVHQDINSTAAKLADVLIAQVERSAFSQIIETGEAIAEAKSAGIEVVIALTPLHPEIYRQIHESPTASKINEGLEDLFSMARGLDVTTLGSFEPYAAGCKARDFASVVVPGAICLQRSLDAAILTDSTQPAR